MTAKDNGSEQELELGKDAFSHPFLKRIMSDDLEEHARKASICGRSVTNLQFADALVEEEQ